jgi:hypothetical protein
MFPFLFDGERVTDETRAVASVVVPKSASLMPHVRHADF